MRKGPLKIPVKVLNRTIEFLDGTPIKVPMKIGGHMLVHFGNLLSHFYKVHHFDSVGEFLKYQDNLAIGTDRVAFHEVEVIGRRDDHSHDKHVSKGDRTAKFRLELDLADRTGQTKLVYPYSSSIISDPVLGAELGDKVEIYAAKYRGVNDPLLLLTNFHMRNDAHYERLQNLRY